MGEAPGELPRRWVVVCEALEDFAVSTGLATRWLGATGALPEWLRDNLSTYVAFGGDSSGSDFTRWSAIPARLRELDLRPRLLGFRPNLTGLAGAEIWRAIAMVTREGREVPAGVLIVRDTDERSGKPEGRAQRTTDYRTLVEALRKQFATNPGLARLGICLALPHPELEAWLLNGFEPRDEEERARLEALTAELGFDPTTSPERLNPGRVHRTDDGGPIERSTKRVLAALIAEDNERRLSCWQRTSLEALRERGQSSGLCAFFAELDARVCPTLDPDYSTQ